MLPIAIVFLGLLHGQTPNNRPSVPVIDPAAKMSLRGAASDISGETGAGSAKFSVLKKGASAYACEVQSAKSTVAIKQADTLYITYEARCLAAENESQTGAWNLRIQRPTDPYDGPFESSGSVGKTWRRFHGSFKADKDYAAGQLLVTFHVAMQRQSVEFRGLQLSNYGPNVDPKVFPINRVSYAGQEADAAWRKTAAAMIEKNRKANLLISAKPGAKVHVKMLRHLYPFGTVTGVDVARTDPDAQKFFAFMKANYSKVTVPVYWSDWGWESAEQRAKYRANLEWCVKNGYRMKAHNLIWPSYKWAPKAVQGLDAAGLSAATTRALDERIAVLKKYKFETVDVVNELISEHDFEDKIGLGFAVEAFKKAKAAWPGADLVYNDYMVQDGDGVNPRYLAYANKLKSMGAPISLLGYQAHFGESLPSIPWLWKLLDTAKAQTGLPVEITEFDFNTRDDATQAEFTRDIVTAWFAHPQSRGFTMWGFWEGDHWIPSSAMVRKDWSLRPAAVAWQTLVTKTWWTDVVVIADKKGKATVRGFKGDYEIRSGRVSRRASLIGGNLAVRL